MPCLKWQFEKKWLGERSQIHIVHIFLIPNESSVQHKTSSIQLPDHIPVYDPAASLMPQSLDF